MACGVVLVGGEDDRLVGPLEEGVHGGADGGVVGGGGQGGAAQAGESERK